MRYLVRARVKHGSEQALVEAIDRGTLGLASVAEGEYLRNMAEARSCPDGTTRWVEVCYCPTPLQEERPYWEEFFELVKVQDAHDDASAAITTEPNHGRAVNARAWPDSKRS